MNPTKKMQEVVTTRKEIYSVSYRLKGLDASQDAIIQFVDGAFTECDYHVTSLRYTEADWAFLGQVAETIAEVARIERNRYAELKERVK